MFSRFVAVFIALAALPLTVQAATIDFGEVLLPGPQATNELSLSNVDIVTTEGLRFGLFIFAPGASGAGGMGGFCATVDSICTGSATIGFKLGPVSDLMFRVASFDDGDTAAAFVFADPTDPIGSLLGTRAIDGNGVVSFAGVSGIRALALIFTGGQTGGGILFTDFSFTQGTETPVIPLPATLPIMLTALGAFGLARRRRT